MSRACSFLSLGARSLVVSGWRQSGMPMSLVLRGPASVWGPAGRLATVRPPWPRLPRSAVVFNGAARRRPHSAGAQLGGWQKRATPRVQPVQWAGGPTLARSALPESTGWMTAPGGCNDRGALSLHRGQTATPGTPHRSVGHNGLRGPLTTCGQFHPKKKSHAAAGKRRHGGHPRPPASPCEGCGALRRLGHGLVATRLRCSRGWGGPIGLCDSRRVRSGEHLPG